MNKSIKSLLVVFFSFIVLNSFSQKFGVKAGLNLSNMLEKDNEVTYSEDYKMKLGFNVGGNIEISFNDMLSFEPGLSLSTKGYKIKMEEDGVEVKGSVNLLYIDVPLNAKASFDLGGAKLFVLAGPYAGFGITGKYKVKSEGISIEQDIEWGTDEESDLKRLDFGINAGVGVQINSFEISAGYGLGLANLAPQTEGGYKIANRVIGISLGYKFGK